MSQPWPGQRPATLVEGLHELAASQPDRTAVTFIGDGDGGGGGRDDQTWDYRRLDEAARAVVGQLTVLDAHGERALLLLPPGPGYLAAFLGCLYAGVVAVPAYPPDPTRWDRSATRARAVVADCDARVILTIAALRPTVERALDRSAVQVLTVDDPREGSDLPKPVTPAPDSLAYLQYTSGSTATPRGVMLTHANLVANLEVIQNRFRLAEGDRALIWLPPYHDMGLVGGLLAPLYSGVPVTVMTPTAFLSDPLRWLREISEHGATCSGGPNFAYELCARRATAEQTAGLDLGGWEIAFCGAEPVRTETVDAFAAAFASCGFRPRSFYACYGLAEATLMVSGGDRGLGARVAAFSRSELARGLAVEADQNQAQHSQRLVSCGTPVAGHHVTVVDPCSGVALASGSVGEIWVRGPSVGGGYWGRPDETERTFHARLAGDPHPWLRTGDLGFLHDRELFLTGRHKDLLIVRGRNVYPHDLERTVEGVHQHLRPGRGAVFAVPDPLGEHVVAVHELDRECPAAVARELIPAVCRAVAADHDLTLHEVLLIRAGTIPKTPSGKIRRSACRDAYVSGAFEVVARGEGGPNGIERGWLDRTRLLATPAEDRLALVCTYLGDVIVALGGVRPEQAEPDLAELGLDSLARLELGHRVARDLDVDLDVVRNLVEDTTVVDLARRLLAGGLRTSPASAGFESVEGDHPVTPGQRALLFLHAEQSEDSPYTIARAAWLRGPLDVASLARAADDLVARHAALRTSFPERGDGLVQRVAAASHGTLHVREATTDDDAAFAARLRAEAHAPFDLATGPLLRLVLFRRGPDEHVLLLAVHHLVVDLWSLAVLLGELRELYEARLAGRPARLPAAGQYPTYARRHVAALASPGTKRAWEYWKRQLAGPLPRLRLPMGQRLSQAPAPSRQVVDLSPELTRAVRELAAAHHASLYVTLLSVFHVLLHRLSGHDDVIVGSPVAARHTPDTGRMVGFCVNTLPIRADLSDDPPFAEVVARNRTTVREAVRHQQIPLALLVDRLRPSRMPGQTPLFEAAYLHYEAHLPELPELAAFALGESGPSTRLGAAIADPAPLPPTRPAFELVVATGVVEDRIRVVFESDPRRFAAVDLRTLAGHYRRIVGAAVADPHVPVSRLPLLDPAVRHRLLVEWNATSRPRTDRRLHDLVIEQARRTPEAPAILHGPKVVTYRELDARSDALAAVLRARGVRPETRVGVFAGRAPGLVVGLLAILKAGGAYVPLDPAYPAERLSFLLADAGVSVLLRQRGQEAGQGASPPDCGASVVYLDDPVPQGSAATVPTPCRDVGPDHLAYVLYTSGSTGRPKGVAISHRSAVNLVEWAREEFSAAELARTLASTSICFDLSVFEIFAPLATGGAVVLVEDFLALPELVNSGVTLVNTVPSALRALLAAGGLPDSVRTVNLAGEALDRDLVRDIYKRTGVRRVRNLYGPSEATTYATAATLPSDPEEPVSIGLPVANTEAYVLDSTGEPVPVGACGELFLGGVGLARGYLGRARLTADRFVPDPFTGRLGARLYRTGDLVRRRRDGELEFVGRVDHQVKLRGLRIELGEIESVLRTHPDVREAVAVVTSAGAQQRIVAYVVNAPGAASADPMREYLRARLPAYMVPAQIVRLASLPLTPNGKVDRSALANLRPDAVDDDVHVPPRTPTEARICALWAEVLGRESIGVHDNFFDLGGNSLLALQTASRLQAAHGVTVAVQVVFEHQTPAELAARLDAPARPAEPVGPSIPVLPRVPYAGP